MNSQSTHIKKKQDTTWTIQAGTWKTVVQQDTHLVQIVSKLPLCDCPWPLMVTLECSNLISNNWRSTTAIIVN